MMPICTPTTLRVSPPPWLCREPKNRWPAGSVRTSAEFCREIFFSYIDHDTQLYRRVRRRGCLGSLFYGERCSFVDHRVVSGELEKLWRRIARLQTRDLAQPRRSRVRISRLPWRAAGRLADPDFSHIARGQGYDAALPPAHRADTGFPEKRNIYSGLSADAAASRAF